MSRPMRTPIQTTLSGAPRPGKPRKITDARVGEVLTMILELPPENRTHWSRHNESPEPFI